MLFNLVFYTLEFLTLSLLLPRYAGFVAPVLRVYYVTLYTLLEDLKITVLLCSQVSSFILVQTGLTLLLVMRSQLLAVY